MMHIQVLILLKKNGMSQVNLRKIETSFLFLKILNSRLISPNNHTKKSNTSLIIK